MIRKPLRKALAVSLATPFSGPHFALDVTGHRDYNTEKP